MATWKLKKPSVQLTKEQSEWFSWAEEGAKSALDDEDWLLDNDDADTIRGQIDDMKYRIDCQARDVAETDATVEQLRGRLRCIDCLMKKLNEIGYFAEEYHK
jgi:hypothetical protein